MVEEKSYFSLLYFEMQSEQLSGGHASYLLSVSVLPVPPRNQRMTHSATPLLTTQITAHLRRNEIIQGTDECVIILMIHGYLLLHSHAHLTHCPTDNSDGIRAR